MHGVNLDLLTTTPHHPDGRPRDPHARHRDEHLAARRAERAARWRALARRMVQWTDRTAPAQPCPDADPACP